MPKNSGIYFLDISFLHLANTVSHLRNYNSTGFLERPKTVDKAIALG